MDLDLKAFSLTLAVGLCVAIVFWAACYVVQPGRAETLAGMLRSDSRTHILPAVVVGVVLLAIGIICEDLSKNAVSFRVPVAFGPQLRGILSSEIAERCYSMTIDSSACLDFDTSPPAHMTFIRLGRLGRETWNVLQRLHEHKKATPEEALVFDRLTKFMSNEACPPDPTTGKTETSEICGRYSEELRDVFQQVYYLAKNKAYADANFFKELEALRVRFDFERSMAFVLLAGIYAVSFTYLAQSTRAMWLDVGGWKTGISVALAALLLVVAADIVTSPELFNAPCRHDPHCERPLQAGRTWLLPACLLFVCAYRLRRVYRRIAVQLASLLHSTLSGPPVLSHEREREAWRALKVIAGLAALLVPTAMAYQSDQINYLNRVYGYYQSMRGAVVECPDLPCKPAPKA